jgi:hypothetical protein
MRTSVNGKRDAVIIYTGASLLLEDYLSLTAVPVIVTGLDAAASPPRVTVLVESSSQHVDVPHTSLVKFSDLPTAA